MIDEARAVIPSAVHDGLACYETGQGEPLFLMPYPHGFGRAPIVQEPLAVALRELNQQVVSFDPPGMFNTGRAARISMPEMLSCTADIIRLRKSASSFGEPWRNFWHDAISAFR